MDTQTTDSEFFGAGRAGDGNPCLAMLNRLPFGVCVINRRKRFVFANSVLCRHLKCSEAELVDSSLGELKIDLFDAIPEQYWDLDGEKGVVDPEWHSLTVSKNDHCLNLSVNSLQLGKETFALITTLDLSPLHIIPKASHSVSEERFNRLFEASPVPMGYAFEEDDYRSSRWNVSWHQTFGYSPEETEGKSGGDVGLWVVPEQRAEFISSCKRGGTGQL